MNPTTEAIMIVLIVFSACSAGFSVGRLSVKVEGINQSEVYQQIEECEKELPRHMKCIPDVKMKIVPVEKE